jgi:hypothetical protein
VDFPDARTLAESLAGVAYLAEMLARGEFFDAADFRPPFAMLEWVEANTRDAAHTIYDTARSCWEAYEIFADDSVLCTGAVYEVFPSVGACRRATQESGAAEFDEATAEFMAYAKARK